MRHHDAGCVQLLTSFGLNMLGGAASTQGTPAKPEVAGKPLIGKLIDRRFRVLSLIGSGGMADVYEVEHALLGRRLAMKVLRQTRAVEPRLVRRFLREARAASRLNSEHVVSIHEYGELPEGSPYFVMELLRGNNLRQELTARTSIPSGRAANLAIDVCLGLNAAHRAGLVHRDLKPENLWLTQGDDGRERCILLDFGVARFEGSHSTGDGILVGTARYMSPEQIEGGEAPGPRSDLFSLGAILYECLTGISPFAAGSLERTLFRILNEVPKPIFELVPDAPQELWPVIERLLAKRPEQRFENALALAASLRAFASGPRLLPALVGPGCSLSDNTLADEDLRADELLTPEVVAATANPAPRSNARALWGFLLGVAVGGVALWLFRPTPAPLLVTPAVTPRAAAAPRAAMVVTESSATVSHAAPIGSTPSSGARSLEPVTRPKEGEAPTVRGTSSKLQPVVSAPPPNGTLQRRAFPRLDFDGRNPYLQ